MQKKSFVQKQKKVVWIFLALFISTLLIAIVIWAFCFRYYKRTNDAYVQGNKVVITPLVDGFVSGIYSDDTYLVKKGQLVVQLDTTDSQLTYQEAASEYAQAVREVCGIYHQVFAYQNEIEMKEARWVEAQEFYNHRLQVLSQGAISLEDFQSADAKLQETYFDYSKTQNLYQKEVVKIIGRSIEDNPLVLQAKEKLEQAIVNLSRCKIYSPVEGLVAQRGIQIGMWVKSGTPLLSIIPLDQIWIDANFKETQMKQMKIGQSVKLTADMYGSKIQYSGKIAGLPGGAGNAFSILPPQNLSGNWIKIVQRLPVRVQIDSNTLKKHPLRIGMTMKAKVDIRNTHGDYVPNETDLAPNYLTSIYDKELELGRQKIRDLFYENLDPSLSGYVKLPFYP